MGFRTRDAHRSAQGSVRTACRAQCAQRAGCRAQGAGCRAQGAGRIVEGPRRRVQQMGPTSAWQACETGETKRNQG